jgi:hypothetical protein
LPDFSWYKIPRRGKIYLTTTKIPKARKIYPMAVNNSKWPEHKTTFFIPRSSKIEQN